LLSSARTTSVHFIGNAYLPIKKHLLCYGNFLKMDCISSTRSGEVILWKGKECAKLLHTWAGQIYQGQAHSSPLSLSSENQIVQCILLWKMEPGEQWHKIKTWNIKQLERYKVKKNQ
jgi:hypothetical protein